MISFKTSRLYVYIFCSTNVLKEPFEVNAQTPFGVLDFATRPLNKMRE